MWQVIVGFGWGTVVGFAGAALAFSSIWILLAVMPVLLTSILLVETISTAHLTKVPHLPPPSHAHHVCDTTLPCVPCLR